MSRGPACEGRSTATGTSCRCDRVRSSPSPVSSRHVRERRDPKRAAREAGEVLLCAGTQCVVTRSDTHPPPAPHNNRARAHVRTGGNGVRRLTDALRSSTRERGSFVLTRPRRCRRGAMRRRDAHGEFGAAPARPWRKISTAPCERTCRRSASRGETVTAGSRFEKRRVCVQGPRRPRVGKGRERVAGVAGCRATAPG